MRVYGFMWQAVAAALALTGVGIALLTVPLPVVVPIAAYLVVLGGQLYVRHPLSPRASRPGTAEPGKRSLTSPTALRAGGALAAGASGLLGWTIALGPATIGLALLLAAGSPPALTWYQEQRRRHRPTPPPQQEPQALPHPMPVGDVGDLAEQPTDAARRDRVAAELAGISVQALCWQWRTSFTALQASADPRIRAQVAEDRQLCLDELERRNPVAFQRWLDSGARAASDPGSYLLGSTPTRDHRTAGS